MRNQIILWAMLLVPWLTLFFMKREEIKRYISVGLFSAATSIIIHDVGIRLGIWAVQDIAYPFYSLETYLFGLFPVVTMWVLKFTYGRFWIYMGTNAILDLGFNFFFIGYILPSLGIVSFVGGTPFRGWFITIGHAILVYGFQMWYEGEPFRLRVFGLRLQPAATKPLVRDKNNKDKQ